MASSPQPGLTDMIKRLLCLAVLLSLVPAARADEKPDEYCRNFLLALSGGRIDGVVGRIPQSWLAEADGVRKDLLNRISPELWNRAFGVLKKTVRVLKAKKANVLAQPSLRSLPVRRDELKRNYDVIVTLLSAFTASELADHATASKTDLRTLLNRVGGRALEQAIRLEIKPTGWTRTIGAHLRGLRDTKVTIDREEGPKAFVHISMPGAEADETTPVRWVDGHWVPVELIKSWNDGLAGFKSELARIDKPALAKLEPLILAQLARLDTGLDGLLAAENEAEFRKRFEELVAPFTSLASSP
jgi:hypothetical protein